MMIGPIEVDIVDEHGFGVDADALSSAARVALERHAAAIGGQGGALTIVIETDEAVAALNAQFRGVDAPTDVLSFPADNPPIELPDEPRYLGDVIIAHDYARAQAEREGHSLIDDLRLLVVHGVLHLLGYDHGTMEERTRMWAEQDLILRDLHISPDIVPALEKYLDDHEHDRH